MSNSIRTPRQGITDTSRRIAQAVDDEDWQRYRLSMKGKPTDVKIQMLEHYFYSMKHASMDYTLATLYSDKAMVNIVDCDICIRIDNYIKALCRGGQLEAKLDLAKVINANWNLGTLIRK